MARIRTIKPEFFTSEDIVGLSALARLLYIALWCEADREGRLLWKPKTFKLRYLPADECDADALSQELIDQGLVVLYGDGLAYIPKFGTHQHLNPREAASTLPEPHASATRQPRVADASARVPHAQGGREGKGRERETPCSPPADAGRPPRKKSERITFATFVTACRDQGQKPIPAGDPIFTFAEDAKIPLEFIALAWRWFSAKHRDGRKQQAGIVGWRAHFRDAVRGNWAKAWYFPQEGEEAALTTVGVGLKREQEASAARRPGPPSEEAAA